MAFVKVCALADIAPGAMDEFDVGNEEILIVHTADGLVRAMPASCPHQDHPLADGTLEGNVLTCSAHLWQFDVESGNGINPDDTRLSCIPVKIENGDVFVDLEASSAP